MDKDYYRELIHEAPFGYAYHKIILDAKGMPIDYEFLEVNKAFQKLTGLEEKNIINKRFREVFPKSETEEFDWARIFGKIALEGGNEEFEEYFESLKCWYKIQVHSQKKNYFHMIFTDITKEKESIEELNKFFDVNLDLLCIVDIKGNFIKMNREFENVFGYTKEELLKKKYSEMIHPDDMESTLNELKKLIYDKKTIDFVNRTKTKKGDYRYIEWRGYLEGELIYSAGRDITEQKAKEEELIVGEERYRALLETSREIIIVIQEDRMVFFNQMLPRLTGYSEDELLNMKVDDLIYRDELNLAMNNYNKKASGEYIHPYQFRIMDKNSKTIWLEISATQMNWNGENAILCFFTDVSKRREYEEALRESESRKAALIKSMDDIIIVLDKDFVFKEYFAPGLESLYLKPENFLGKKFSEVGFPKQVFDIVNGALEKAKRTGQVAQAEYFLDYPKCREWFDLRVTLISCSENEDVEFLCVTRNITKLKESEEEIRLERDLFSEGPVMTMIWDYSDSWPVKMVSKNVEVLLGYKVEDIVNSNFKYAAIIHPEDIGKISSDVKRHIEENENSFEQSYRIKSKAGEYRWYYDFTRVARNAEGEVTEIRGYLFDQSRIKDVECQLQEERERLNNIIEGTNAGTWEWNVQTHETKIDGKWAEIMGYTLEEIPSMTIDTWKSIVHPDDFAGVWKKIEKHFARETKYYEAEYRVKNKSGEWIWILSRGKVMSWTEKGEPLLMFGIKMNINKRKKTEQKVMELSIRDPLTNIYNRRYIFERLNEIKAKYKRVKEDFSITIIDIDYFKNINDYFGHMVGDHVLQEFTKIIQKKIRSVDLLGRYGGEEFIIVMINCEKTDALKRISNILEETRNTVFKFNEDSVKFTFSAGIADSNDFDFNSITLDKLIDTADKRLYKAKQSGRNRIVITNEID